MEISLSELPVNQRVTCGNRIGNKRRLNGAGNGVSIMERVLAGKYAPSRRLLEHMAAMVQGSLDIVSSTTRS